MKNQSFCLQHDLIKKITLSLCPSNIIVCRMALGHSGFDGLLQERNSDAQNRSDTFTGLDASVECLSDQGNYGLKPLHRHRCGCFRL